MPIEFNHNCRDALVRKLAGSLACIRIKNGMFLDFPSITGLGAADEVLPHHGAMRSLLANYISDQPVTDFTIATLHSELRDLDDYKSEPAMMLLNQVDGFHDPEAVARSLVAKLQSLPWRYALTLRLPFEISEFFLSQGLTEYELSPTFRILPTGQVTEQFPLSTSNSARLRRFEQPVNALLAGLGGEERLPLKWSDESAFLQLDASGFIDPFGMTTPYVTSEHSLKAFFGLGIALFLFRAQHTWSPWPLKNQIYVHRQNGEVWELEDRLDVDDDKSRALNSMRMNTEVLKERLMKAWAPKALEQMRAVFSAGTKSKNIQLACQWLYEAHTSRDDLARYVNAMVVLEILLGESGREDMSLSELLRNRCAYLIGRNRQERDELLKDVQQIYKVRSLILHRGKPMLTGAERKSLWRLLWICQQVIQKEVDLLVADPKPMEPTG